MPEQQSGIDFTSILFALLLVKLLDPLFEIAEYLSVLRIAIQSEQKLESILNEPVLVEPINVKIPLNFDIELENISFLFQG